jgi:hypothetical protein
MLYYRINVWPVMTDMTVSAIKKKEGALTW